MSGIHMAVIGPGSVLATGTITVGNVGTVHGFSTTFTIGSQALGFGTDVIELFWDEVGTINRRISFVSALPGSPSTIQVSVGGTSAAITGDGQYFLVTSEDLWNLSGRTGQTLDYVVTA